MVAETSTGYALLDKHFLKTRQHPRGHGIEACDLLGPDNELIHVKRAEQSAPLSHLFAQGEVSVDALIHEADARQRLVAQVHSEQPGHRTDTDFRPRKVVYAIALDAKKPLTADTLFTFSQVSLYRAARRLRLDNIEVEVVAIPTSHQGAVPRRQAAVAARSGSRRLRIVALVGMDAVLTSATAFLLGRFACVDAEAAA